VGCDGAGSVRGFGFGLFCLKHGFRSALGCKTASFDDECAGSPDGIIAARRQVGKTWHSGGAGGGGGEGAHEVAWGAIGCLCIDR
jgi:hypothetical protein